MDFTNRMCMKSTGRINQNGVYWFEYNQQYGSRNIGWLSWLRHWYKVVRHFLREVGAHISPRNHAWVYSRYILNGVKGGYINQLITNGHLCGEKIYWLELVYGGSLWLILAISTYQALQWNGIQVLFIVVIPASSRSPFCGYNGYINPYWSRDDHRPKTGSLLYNVTSWKSRRSS